MAPFAASAAARVYRTAAGMASDLELAPYRDDPDSLETSPDSPLLTPTQTQPRWLEQSSSRFRRAAAAIVTRATDHKTPWQTKFLIAIVILFALYILICVVRKSPLFASKLPATYTGPYAVGAVDIEHVLPSPRAITNTTFSATGKPAFELATVLVTIYYPIHKGTETNVHNPWLARPISATAHGYAKFARLNNFLFRPIFTSLLWLIAGSIDIPAHVDAPLATDRDTHPVTVFSHGMASSKTDYTAYLSELASHGHVVAAVEHRDGSCPGTIIRRPGQPDATLLHFRESDLGGIETLQLKKEQLAFREEEVLETVNLLRALHEGKGPAIQASNPLKEGKCLAGFQGRLDMTNVTVAGHSYGATLAMQAMANSAFKAGVALDPGKESGRLNENIAVPLLIVNSEAWSRNPALFFGKPHFSVVKDIASQALNKTGVAWFLTSKGTAHPSVSDAPLLEPVLMSLVTGSRWDTKASVRNYASVTLDFLERIETGKVDGLLAEDVTHEEYGKWTSPERKKEFSKEFENLWQIHVSPMSGTP